MNDGMTDMYDVNTFKSKLSGGQVFGMFMKSGDPAFVEAAGYAGLDFAVLDMEHGPVGLERMQNNVRAAQLARMAPVIRVPSLSETAVGQALDIGAYGVQVPQITSADEARRAVRYGKFHPAGERGACRFVRAALYSATTGGEYFRNANQTLIILQLEGVAAIESLDAILDVQGVDIMFIGPYDLSQSLGLPGQTTHPAVVSAMRDIVGRAAAKNIATGTFTDSEETLRMWVEAGVRYITYSVDVGVFMTACREARGAFEKITGAAGTA